MEVLGWVVIACFFVGLLWAIVGDSLGFESSSLASLWISGIALFIIFLWGSYDEGVQREARLKARAERQARGEVVPEASNGSHSSGGIRPIIIPRRR